MTPNTTNPATNAAAAMRHATDESGVPLSSARISSAVKPRIPRVVSIAVPEQAGQANVHLLLSRRTLSGSRFEFRQRLTHRVGIDEQHVNGIGTLQVMRRSGGLNEQVHRGANAPALKIHLPRDLGWKILHMVRDSPNGERKQVGFGSAKRLTTIEPTASLVALP